jgi:hypothetical protein
VEVEEVLGCGILERGEEALFDEAIGGWWFLTCSPASAFGLTLTDPFVVFLVPRVGSKLRVANGTDSDVHFEIRRPWRLTQTIVPSTSLMA